MQRVTFTAAYPADLTHPLHRAIVEHDGVTRADVLSWGPVGSATQLSWFDADPDAVRDLLAGYDAVETAELVAGDARTAPTEAAEPGTYAFTRQSGYAFADVLLDVVEAADVAFLPPLSFRGDGTARVDAVGESDALASFYDALADVVEVTVESVGAFHRGGDPAALTARQREALGTAVDLGYYEVPRTASVADVAAALDCAHSTAGELLRKAEARVVADAVR